MSTGKLIVVGLICIFIVIPVAMFIYMEAKASKAKNEFEADKKAADKKVAENWAKNMAGQGLLF